MSLREDLYRAVLASPDHDGPRRRYAAQLEQEGDELGEYIRLSLDGDRDRLSEPAVTRALVLHNQLRVRMTAPIAAWIRSHQRDRGLVALVEMDGQTFIDHGTEVFALAPIQHLDLVDTKGVFAQLVQSPILERVQTLALERNALGDQEAELLAASPYARHLVYLSLFGNKIGQPGLEAITASKNLAGLKVLHFDYNLVESPVTKLVSDGVSGLADYVGGGPLKALLIKKYGHKAWMDPPDNVDRSRMCDAGE